MVDRTAIRRSPALFAAVLLLAGWIALGAAITVGSMSTEAAYEFIGQTPTSGWLGVLVMLVVLGLLLLVYAELDDGEELPDRFPPDDRE